MAQHIGTFTTGHVVTAAELNAIGPYYTSGAGAPAGTGANSDTYYDTTNKRGYYSDGVGWVILFEPEQTWAASISGLTLGNGTRTGGYKRGDGWIDCWFKVVFGSTSAVTGAIVVTHPIAASAGINGGMFHGEALDAGTQEYPLMAAGPPSSTTVEFRAIAAGGTYASSLGLSSTVPFTWGTSDTLYGYGRYPMTTKYS